MTRFYWIIAWLIYLLLLWEGAAALCLLFLSKYKQINYAPIDQLRLNSFQKYILSKAVSAQTTYLIHDKELGLTVRPDGSNELYRSNSQGLRADHDFSYFPDERRIRIATFGDSFTHGDEVRLEHTWQYLAQQLRPQLEFINFGVPTYGPGQSYLRYLRRGVEFHPDVVFIGFMSENIFRSVNTFRPFYFPDAAVPIAKPRFKLAGSELVAIKSPVEKIDDYMSVVVDDQEALESLGSDDWFYQNHYHSNVWDFLPSVKLVNMTMHHSYFREQILDRHGLYNTDSEAFRVSAAILEKFCQVVKANGSIPVILLLPDRNDVNRIISGKVPSYQPLLELFTVNRVNFIDLGRAFRKVDSSVGSAPFYLKFHYSWSGNQLISESLVQNLDSVLTLKF